MARKVRDVKIADKNRDAGKVFRVTEMDAADGEEWGYQFLLVLARAGIQAPDPSMGMAGVALAGLQSMAGLNFQEIKPLLDTMFLYIKRIPDPNRPEATIRALVPDDTEEISTRIELRKVFFELNTGFFEPGLLSKIFKLEQTEPQVSSATPTSVQTSA